jgi:hypothetical protein
METKKTLTVADFLLQLTSLAFPHQEILPPKILNGLCQICWKIMQSHDGSQSRMAAKLVEVLSEVFSDLDYQTSSTPTNSGIAVQKVLSY